MINPRAITEYLEQERDNFNWIKSVPEKDLDDEIRKLRYTPVAPLMVHQKACFLLSKFVSNFCFWNDLGTGKTSLVLELVNYYLEKKKITKGLVLCPTNELVQVWEDEIQKWKFSFPYRTLKESTKKKWDDFNEFERGLVIGTYSGVLWMLSEKQKVKGKDLNRLVPAQKLMNRFLKELDLLVLDQSTSVSNSKSPTYRACNQLSKQARFRFALAGRPIGRDPTKWWAQYYLIDRGETLSPSLGFFQEVFFSKKRGYFGGFEYTFRKSLESDLARIIAHRSIRYSTDECFDLPDLVRIIEKLQFPETTEVYYKRIIRELIQAYGKYTEVKNSFIRLRQISSGFLGVQDDETGEKAHIEFPDNPKLDLLLQRIQEMPSDKKFLIFYEYTWSGAKICNELKKNKIRHGWLWSGTKNWASMYKSFNEDPNFKGLVIQNKKGIMGLNLQSANYVFIYESPVSIIDRDELEGRARRKGQIHKVIQYDLVIKRSVDEKILKYHKEGKDLYKALVDDPSKVVE